MSLLAQPPTPPLKPLYPSSETPLLPFSSHNISLTSYILYNPLFNFFLDLSSSSLLLAPHTIKLSLGYILSCLPISCLALFSSSSYSFPTLNTPPSPTPPSPTLNTPLLTSNARAPQLIFCQASLASLVTSSLPGHSSDTSTTGQQSSQT